MNLKKYIKLGLGEATWVLILHIFMYACVFECGSLRAKLYNGTVEGGEGERVARPCLYRDLINSTFCQCVQTLGLVEKTTSEKKKNLIVINFINCLFFSKF